MSNVSIYDKNWIDLVFEGKNKAYGAYQLRQENSKTSLLALLGGAFFFLTVIGLGLFLTSFGEKSVTEPIIDDALLIRLSEIHPPKNDSPKKDIAIPLKDKPAKKIENKELKNPIIVKSNDNPDDVKSNKEIKNNSPENSNPNGSNASGIGMVTSAEPGTKSAGTEDGEKKENIVNTTNELDRLPEFPGGIKAFHRYIGEHIDKPETDSDVATMTVIMSFVIEKDGSMTDIKILRSTDKELEKAAIKVLKSLKTKWAPGYKDGEKVRTLYVQPIRVNY
ncbi:energy transducer TonB [Flavobacterium silvisoli]|uniref:Energy transducer TonB n=1 Tax=Flavobacterium silvisoli TaxID=2529433 RepID=A0A4Q9YUN2_9FLAO|nr:energy transducer TonB [Flavobacterium silvisoli]TBX64990.1 energy transducer TonB [Flavobacterium silvisoli]